MKTTKQNEYNIFKMKTENSKIEILERFKISHNLKTDAELARYLGVSPGTLSNWKSRNSIDYDLLFSKCEYGDLNWLLTGQSANKTDTTATQTMCESPAFYGQEKQESEIYYKMYREKDAEVSILREQIGALRNEVETLKKKNEDLKKENENFAEEITLMRKYTQNLLSAESARAVTAQIK